MEDEGVEPGEPGGGDLEEGHELPVRAEGATAPVSGVDDDGRSPRGAARRAGAGPPLGANRRGEAPGLEDGGTEAGVGGDEDPLDLLGPVAADAGPGPRPMSTPAFIATVAEIGYLWGVGNGT